MRRFERYVALGDSTTEGIGDPDGQGGHRGWADRLAERIAAAQGGLLYANLAVRGKRARAIRLEQLEAAVALKPDLASAMVGMNDLIAPGFDLGDVTSHLEQMARELTAVGTVVLTFTLPDLSAIAPIARLVSRRNRALNAAIRAASARSGATLIDLAAEPLVADPRLWQPDRLHASPQGHSRLGHYVARQLGVPGDDSWADPLPALEPMTLGARVLTELQWARTYVLPWAVRVARGVSMGDGLAPKRPRLEPVAKRT